VRDTGRGIPVERHAEVFQPFNRLGAEQGVIEGTGIGLTITQRLVHLMGGIIDFQSVPDSGTTFIIDLPVATDETIDLKIGRDDMRAPAQAYKGGYNLLYVEDNPSNIELMKGLIDTLDDVRLLTASHPKLGLSLAREHRPDIIILDIDLPDMNGFELLKE